MSKERTITATFDGTEYAMSIPKWVIFLEDKPVQEHITSNTMRVRLRRSRDSKITMEEVLGIKGIVNKYNTKNSSQPIVSNYEKPMYDFRNKFIRRALL